MSGCWLRASGRLAKPKSGKVRSVPLIDQAGAALDALSRRQRFMQPSDLVFVGDTGSYSDDGELRRRFYAALRRAGLGHKRHENPPLRFHDLRHTFGKHGSLSHKPPAARLNELNNVTRNYT